MQVANLVIDMAANVARLRNDMDQARKVVEGTTAKMQKAAQMATKALGLIGAGLAIGGISSFIKGAIQAMDEMSKLSQKAGIAVKDVAGLQLAFRQSGLDAGALQASMQRLNKGIADGSKAFDAMGLSTKNADGSLKNSRQMLGEVADKFAQYQDGASKAALAQEIFGKAGADMIPLLNGGAESLDNFDAMAKKLGLTIDQDTGRAAEKFNDTLDLMGQGMQGVGRQIGAQILPTLQTLADKMFGAVMEGDRLVQVSNAIAFGMKVVGTAFIAVIEVVSMFSRSIVGAFQAIKQALTGDFSGAWETYKSTAVSNLESTRSAIASIGGLWTETGNSTVSALAGTTAAAKTAAPIVDKLGKATKSAGKDAKETADEFEKLYAKIMAKDTGFDADYAKNMAILAQGFADGKRSLEELKKVADIYTRSQKFYTDQTKKLAEEQKRLNDEAGEYFKTLAETEAAQQATIKSATELIDEIERETQALTMTNAEREIAIKLRALETAGLKAGSAEYEIYAQKIREAISGKAAVEESINQQKKAEADWSKTWDQVSQSFTDALMQGGRSVKEYLIGLFRTMVLRPVIMGTIGGIAGMGTSGASAGGLEGMISGGISSFIGGITLGGSSLAAIGSSIGTGFMTTITGGSVAAASGAYTAAGMTGVAGGLSAGAAAATAVPYVAAAVAALSALGVFRSNRIVGGGVTGTLGEGLQEFDVNRRGGSLFSGPKYSNVNFRETEQSQAINNAFLAMRSSTSEMAKQLGLATDKVDVFTSKLEIDFSKLTDEQRMAKINEALQLSGNAMAELVLGAGATAQQLAQLYATVMQERAGLENQLLQLQGNTVEIRRREREALHESNRAIYDQIKALEDQKTANEDAAEAIAKAAEAIAKAAEAQRNALQTARNNTDAAYAALERAVNAQKRAATVTRDVAQQQVSSIKSIMDVLEGGIRNLFQGTREAAFQGMSFIDRALGTARSTGYLPDSQQLQQAITGATQGVTGRTFATKADQIEAQRLLAFKLKDLQDVAGTQLTEAEKQLEVANKQLENLDSILENARAQIDALRGVDNSVMSVEAAINRLADAMALQKSSVSTAASPFVQTQVQAAMAAGVNSGNYNASGATSFNSDFESQIAQVYQSTLGRQADVSGLAYWAGTGQSLSQIATSIAASAEAQARAVGVDVQNAMIQEVNKQLGLTTNIKAFANGGYHTGGMRLVGERGPELEATGPARYYSASQTQSMLGGGVVEEIKGLREEVSMLRAEARATAVNTGRTQDIMKRVTRNGESMIVSTDGEALEVTS